ncbi:kinase-like domain-containing protein [Glomus cerebriforme]|uniref:Kinase-like domain-containing protein n=1 Tax=Glomus cerebriforme TaxID=658196 RepID=A0A397T8F9_9GLOM|nr:kinase-like domain-containing protein [Glomus cerebriforme]
MKKFAEEITQYNKLQKLLGSKNIESKYQELCKEYDSSISSLNFNLMGKLHFNAQEEMKILRDDVLEVIKFQGALIESMDDANTIDAVKMSVIVERVSEMAQTMQNLMDDDKKNDQFKIDNIFQETPLPFEDYIETEDEYRTERLRKYIHIKSREEYAFKTVKNEHVNQVKNQVTILKKLKDCQNIIHFYGLTNDGSKTYIVTEWAENKNLREYISERGQDIEIKLRIRIAYDIAKGLNFLNSVKIVHRDIRSENIVITDYDIAKIANFKLSRGINTATGNLAVIKESVRYCAPEMLRRGEGVVKKKYDTKCEVYSFGILLWEIAECRYPYEQFEDILELTKKVVSGYREKFTLVTEIPEKYQILVKKSVDTNPGIRPIFSRILIDLQDIFKNYTSNLHFLDSNRLTFPLRKMTSSTIAAAAEDYAINYDF